MPLEIRGAHFLIRSAQLVRGTRLEQALVLCQTNYLKIYRADLRQMFRFGNLVMLQMISLKHFFDPSREVAMAKKFCRYQYIHFAGRRRLVVQPGGLTLGFSQNPVLFVFFSALQGAAKKDPPNNLRNIYPND